MKMSASWAEGVDVMMDTAGAVAGFFDTFMLLLLGCLRGDGGRCFPWTALSSWPIFQPP